MMDYSQSPIGKPGKGSQKPRRRAKDRARRDAKAAYRASRPEVCEVCGKGNRALAVHHIVKLSQGGQDVPENYRLLCKKHHDEQHGIFEGSKDDGLD